MNLPGVFIAPADENLAATIDTMNKLTHEWTMQAARGECSWVCSDCCMTFPAGMPDACAHGQQGCTDIITRDKAEAAAAVGKTPNDKGKRTPEARSAVGGPLDPPVVPL